MLVASEGPFRRACPMMRLRCSGGGQGSLSSLTRPYRSGRYKPGLLAGVPSA